MSLESGLTLGLTPQSFSVFHLILCCRLSWLMSAFEHTLKYHLTSYRIVSYGLLPLPFLLSTLVFIFRFSIVFRLLVACARLNWLTVSFWVHVNILYNITLYHVENHCSMFADGCVYRAPHNDCSPSVLQTVSDSIYLNIFDEYLTEISQVMLLTYDIIFVMWHYALVGILDYICIICFLVTT